MQKKSCSNCNSQVYVACRNCPTCKQSFPKTGPIALIMNEYEGLFRRRTERIKREKPNYYDASAFSKRKNPKKTTTKKEDKAVSKEKLDRTSNKKSSSSNSTSKDGKKEKEVSQSVSLPPPSVAQSTKDETKDSSPKPRRKKLMKTKVSKDTEEETYNSIINTQQSAQQCNVILAELNRKLFLTSWRGI